MKSDKQTTTYGAVTPSPTVDGLAESPPKSRSARGDAAVSADQSKICSTEV
jgi:hypothetical protein